MAEKRDLKRYRKRLSLRFGIEGPVRVAFTEDVSQDGLFIKTTNICPPGSRILIDLVMPDDDVINMEARVMWAKKVPPQMIHLVKKSGMGVRITRFVSGEEKYQEMCHELLARSG